MTPEGIAYLRERAKSAGYNADDLLKVINYESSGRSDAWGGKNKDYYGLIQFGPNERKQFGVDTKHPNDQNQVDAALSYLSARGFKPGMGLLDLYSTVNAGSPGHYNASDGNGTVSSHVAKMMGMNAPTTAMSYAPAEKSAPRSITDIINGLTETSTSMPARQSGLIGIRQAASDLQDEGADENDDTFQQAMLNYHNQNHAKAIGLLGAQ